MGVVVILQWLESKVDQQFVTGVTQPRVVGISWVVIVSGFVDLPYAVFFERYQTKLGKVNLMLKIIRDLIYSCIRLYTINET